MEQNRTGYDTGMKKTTSEAGFGWLGSLFGSLALKGVYGQNKKDKCRERVRKRYSC